MCRKMVKIELYVVTTENPDAQQLEQLKVELCKEFGGLTVIPNCEGYWLDDPRRFQDGKFGVKPKMEKDSVQIWVILSSTVITSSVIMKYIERLKQICSQKVQLFVVNGMPYFV